MSDDSEKDQKRVEFARERYMRALHAMQSGVAMELEQGSNSATPKHLRVGVNSAMIDSAAMARVLMAKGLFTLAEYSEALADVAEAEQRAYEERLSGALGVKVTLA